MFAFAVKLIMWLSGIAGWLHDRQQQKTGAINAVAREQNIAIQVMRTAMQAQKIDSREELRERLRSGKF